MFKFAKTFAVVSIIGILTACADSDSINQQAAMGYRDMINEAKSQNQIDSNSKTAQRVHKIFNKMVLFAFCEDQTGQAFDWQIEVIKSKELNAWAMPGGKMAFYTGLVESLNLTDDEIATVMGHEMAHALKEHGKKKANLSQFTNVIAGVAQAALATQIGSDGSTMVVGLAKDWGLDKPYSRSAETEADEVGLFLMAKSGYNPEAAPGLWDKMQKASTGSQGILDKLSSTHPSDKDRQANLLRLMPQALALYKQNKG